MILADCAETRIIDSKDYNEASTSTSSTKATATRMLQQAMVPGAHLVKVEIPKEIYEAKIKLKSESSEANS